MSAGRGTEHLDAVSPIERLTPADLITFWPDHRGWPQDIGALGIFAGDQLLDAQGQPRLEQLRQAIVSRLHLVPRFRQALYVPARGLGRPLWVDARDFDIRQHVQAASLPPGADEEGLLVAIEALRRRPLPQSRPLWQMWFLPGLPRGRVGFYLRVHHAVADGAAAMAMLAAFLDPADDPPRQPAPPWTAQPPPSTRALLAGAWCEPWHRLAGALANAGRRGVGPIRDTEPKPPRLSGLAPRTTLNRPIGSDRVFSLVRTELAQVKTVAHEHAAAVNDVLLTAVAGGLHDLLVARGEPVADVVMRAYVPVSLRHGRPSAEGNVIGSMLTGLPVGGRPNAETLRRVAADTAARKVGVPPRRSPVLRSTWLQQLSLALLAHQRMYNIYVANMPGPAMPLYLEGARLLELFPVVALMGNLSVGVGALSYAGQLDVAVAADRGSCPDVAVFAEGLRGTLRSLGVAVDGP